MSAKEEHTDVHHGSFNKDTRYLWGLISFKIFQRFIEMTVRSGAFAFADIKHSIDEGLKTLFRTHGLTSIRQIHRHAIKHTQREKLSFSSCVDLKAAECEVIHTPRVQEQIVKAGFNKTFTPSLILIGLIKLLTQGQLIRLTVWKNEPVKSFLQFSTVTCYWHTREKYTRLNTQAD